MSKLQMEQELIHQESARNDLHGRNPARIEESAELIQGALEDLEEELSRITEDRHAFDLAQLYCPDYVEGNDFRLMFLRSTQFNASKAAVKIIYYWSRKVDLFGLDRAFRKLSLQDFEEEDQQALRGGGIRSLPGLDLAGRGIVLSYRPYYDNRRSHQKSMERALWFCTHALLEDIDVQRNGMVVIICNDMPSYTISTIDTKVNRSHWRDANLALPVRIQGVHRNIHHPAMAVLYEAVHFVIGQKTHDRTCQHFIRCKDMAPELESYGIAADILPQELGGTLDYDYGEWLDGRRLDGL